MLFACGGGENSSLKASSENNNGFPAEYIPPNKNYQQPNDPDEFAGSKKITYVEPYWVDALLMGDYDATITPILQEHNRTFALAFPEIEPDYEKPGITGWQPSSAEMRVATIDITTKISERLNIEFFNAEEPADMNVLTIALSNQSATAGVSFFPSNFYEVGMDVFISTDFDNPIYRTKLITNYDYEVLVHEIGHALGLKHPFESDGINLSTMTGADDTTRFTAMSYDDSVITFDGNFRPLDWMALAKMYDVNPKYRSGNDTYVFSSYSGTFIIDGAGFDTIDAADTDLDARIDLRYGSHSYLGAKSDKISSPNQLTISHGTNIENVKTGSGNDYVIGNDISNTLDTGDGNDVIYAGGGTDTVKSGTGMDIIDLGEENPSKDVVEITASIFGFGFDTVYGFIQGTNGDVFDVTDLFNVSLEFLPMVSSKNIPTAEFGNGVLCLIGEGLDTKSNIANAFSKNGIFGSLSMPFGQNSLVITANSQDTGEDQNIYYSNSLGDEISFMHLAKLQGNYLDIDLWHSDNFQYLDIA